MIKKEDIVIYSIDIQDRIAVPLPFARLWAPNTSQLFSELLYTCINFRSLAMANSKWVQGKLQRVTESNLFQSRYEYVKTFELNDQLLPNTWTVVRIDGRGFHKCNFPLVPFMAILIKT
jgi:hypothetical protein